MFRFHFVLYSLFICAVCAAQSYDPLHQPDTYRNADNPYYWKNRPPFPGYWQQDVHYTIKAELDDSTDVIDGSEQLTYYNNSPDTLTFVYFHLYQNAFQPGSYLDELTKNNGITPNYSKYEKDDFSCIIHTLIMDKLLICFSKFLSIRIRLF